MVLVRQAGKFNEGNQDMLSPLNSARRKLCAAIALAMGSALVWPAHASDASSYPERPVRLVVSYAPGNVTDTLARLIADKLSAKWKQPVAVENRPGQGGSIGAQSVVNAPADGYTLLFAALASMAINPHVYGSVGYDPLKDFAPIVNVASPEIAMVVTPESGIKTLPDLVAYSKAHPGTLNYGTAGNGTVPHLNMESLKGLTGLDIQHVPYKGATAVLTDLLGGRIDVQQESLGVLISHIESGKLQPVAAVANQRLPQLPDTPTIAEVYPGYEPVLPWLGLFTMAGTPDEIITKVNRDVVEILQLPEVREKLRQSAMTPAGGTAAEFAAIIPKDYERLGKLVQQLGLQVD